MLFRSASANSSDIPDDGNGAVVSASLPVQVAAATDLRVRAAIRSNEADGAPTGDPAGQVGAVLYAKCLSATCAGGAIVAGQVVCTPAGPPAGFDFGTPTGTTTPIGVQSLRNIQVKASRTASAAPEFNAPLATSQEGSDSKCTLPAAGLYELTLTGQFFDFPSSGTPGAKD